MKFLKKIIISTILIILLLVSIYIFFILQNENQVSADMMNQNDNAPPYFITVSDNITGKAGEMTKISYNFSDNIGVTKAIIFYKPVSALHWSSKSIINGSFEIMLPSFSNESWYYYVTIDDAKGNGPVGDPSIDGSLYYTITVLDNNQDNSNENNYNFNTSPEVFVEFATKIICSECPKVSKIMYELYNSGNLPFCYVSLPIDNPNAAEYLKRYNIWGYPTVFIDGGYDLTIGSSVDKSLLQEKIKSAAYNVKHKIQINTKIQNSKDSKSINFNIDIMNKELSLYSGELRVYLTEINSEKWQGGTPEHFSFLSFIIIEQIELNGYTNQTFTKTVDISDLDPENLMIFSVISNNESHTGYSQPPDKNKFEVHYIDDINVVKVIDEGNLPPEVGIENPVVKYVHLFGKPLKKTIYGNTILLGRTSIVAYANDDSKITKVEFYINNKLMKTITEKPYTWMWHTLSIGKKTIIVKAYDDTGKISSASIDVYVLMKWQGLLSRIFSK